MPVTYIHDESPRGSVVIPSYPTFGSHVRRRSSVSSVLAPSYSSQMCYDSRTGEIALPPSPPLYPWKDFTLEKKEGFSEKDNARPVLAWRDSNAKRPVQRLKRPWVSVMLCAGCTVAFIIVISLVSPVGSKYNKAVLSTVSLKTSCDPYASAGSLQVDPTVPENNAWKPFDKSCSAPSYVAQLRSNIAPIPLSKKKQFNLPSPNDLPWLHNRTVLLIGDSVSREHVENFCQLLGLQSEVIRKTHRYAPGLSIQRNGADKPARLADNRKSGMVHGFRVVRDASLPRMCYVPQYDFMLVSVFHFGLDQEDYWRGSPMPQYSSPGMIEHRISDVAQPLINNIRADGRPSAPDMVEVTSGSWDLARWAMQDVSEERATEEGVSADRVTWWRFRAGQVMDKVKKAFPEAKTRVWRTMHYPTDQVTEQDYFMDKINTRTNTTSTALANPPYFSHNRVLQIDQAVRSLIHPVGGSSGSAAHEDWRLNEFGPVLKGHEAHQKDRLHGDALPGGYVWSDIMLYELWRGIKSSEAQALRPGRF